MAGGFNPQEVRDTFTSYQPKDTYHAEVLLREAYEIQYGIFNHGVKLPEPRPLALCSISSIERRSTNGLLERYMQDYYRSGAQSILGLTFQEFCEIPVDRLHYLLKSLSVIASEESKQADINVNKLKQELGG